MQGNLIAYSLLYDLSRWMPQANRYSSLNWINEAALDLQPYLQKAESLVLKGKSIYFDPKAPTPLSSIFNKLLVQKAESIEPSATFPFRPLSLNKEDIFPNNESGDFDALCRGFEDEFRRLPGGEKNPKIFAESLYYLLKKYASCIGLSQDMSYVPLFEFLKIRSAVALSLYAAAQEGVESDLPLQLYCIDQSGIQNFLYNISSNKAAKSLKGRSFYLQMLMESITQSVLSEPDIEAGMVNVLYSSGGKMYWILPNTDQVNNALRKLEEYWLEKLYETHRLEMYLAFGSVKFGWDDRDLVIEDDDAEPYLSGMSRLWAVLGKKTKANGQQAYRRLMAKNFQKLFQPNELDGFESSEGSEKQACAVTGETVVLKGNKHEDRKRHDMLYYDGKKAEGQISENEEESVWVTDEVKKQVDLGYQLQLIKFYKTFYADKFITPGHEYRLFNPLGLRVYHGMTDEENIKDEKRKLRGLPSFNFAIVKKINDPIDFLPGETEDVPDGYQSAYGFVFYGGNKLAQRKSTSLTESNIRKRVKEFSELAGLASEEDKHQGFHRLGVLRMDVDGLGTIFRSGMGKVQSFPAYAAISSQLDLFFSGYLNTIRDATEDRKAFMNIIYSGGDDIFAVGRWDVVLDFAEEVRAAFRQYVNGRERISISAGLALVGPKFPIAKAAKLAGDAEDAAKDFKKRREQAEADKNAICLFDVPVSWEKEFEIVKELKNTMVNLRGAGELTAGFLQRMIDFQTIKNQHERIPSMEEISEGSDSYRVGERPPDTSFLWTSAYYISRYEGRFKKAPEQSAIRQFLDRLKLEFLSALKNEGRFYDLLGVAARWAELEMRMKENKEMEI